jgi:hypothetical protein
MITASCELLKSPDDGLEACVAGEAVEVGPPFECNGLELLSSRVGGRSPRPRSEGCPHHKVGEVIVTVGATRFDDFGIDEFSVEINEEVFRGFGTSIIVGNDGDVLVVGVGVAPI